jgi:predicted Zn-dependent protease with MMP-like domain
MKVVLATSNKGKVREIIELLHDREVFPYTDLMEGFEIVEDGETFKENALIKARAVYAALGDTEAIVIADEPSDEQLRHNGITDGSTLLGLYEGIPLTERGDLYGVGIVLPDKITIFKLPILEEAQGDEMEIRKIVTETVWHEIAHYFGYDDEEIEAREDAGTNHSAA